MPVASFLFLLFVSSVIFVYYIVPVKYRWLVILAANIFFYCSYGVKYLVYLIISSLITFLAALFLRKASEEYTNDVATADKGQKKQFKEKLKKKKKRICLAALAIVLGIWIVLKYTNFFLANINAFLSEPLPLVEWVMPLGISFYTLVLAGYLIDVYRDKYEAETNYLRFFCFVSYFPHIIQGPFSRYDDLGKQLKQEHPFSYDRMEKGARRILWGFFKKLVVADKLAIVIHAIRASYSDHPASYLFFVILMYSFQIYADFSGYMDIMGGISQILGITLAENFRQPYLAKTVDEFWRRWHITLGEWFRDYVFYPLSMSPLAYKIASFARKRWGIKTAKLLQSYLALFFVWTATGLWHEANWKHVLWGYLNMFVIACAMQFADFNQKLRQRLHINEEAVYWKVFCVARTFLLVSILRVISTSDSIATAFSYFGHLLKGGLFVPVDFSLLFGEIAVSEMIAVIVGIAAIIAVDILNETGRWQSFKENCPMVIRCSILTILILSIILFGGGENDLLGGFMYARF